MRRLSQRQQFWISSGVAFLSVALAVYILFDRSSPGNFEVQPVAGGGLYQAAVRGQPISKDQADRLTLAGLNCLRQKQGLAAYRAFDRVLSREAAALEGRMQNPKELDLLDGYTLAAFLTLDFSAPSAGCSVGGVDLSFLASLGKTEHVGIAMGEADINGITPAVLLGR